MTPSDADLSWVAGLFEGEGCIYQTNSHRLNSQTCRLDLAMHCRDIDVLRRLRKIMGRGKLYGPYKNKMIFWIVYGREDTLSVLLELWPWLGKRRKTKASEFFPRLRPFITRRVKPFFKRRDKA